MFPSFVRTIIGPCALISWLKNLHSTRTRPYWKAEKCHVTYIYSVTLSIKPLINNLFSEINFDLFKTYHPVLDERRIKETVLRIWNLPTGQMYLWMRCIIFLDLPLPERKTILRVLKMCKDKQWNHLHKTLTILISTVWLAFYKKKWFKQTFKV